MHSCVLIEMATNHPRDGGPRRRYTTVANALDRHLIDSDSLEFLQTFLTDHRKWLKNASGGKQADLSKMKLEGLDFRGGLLSKAVMVGTDLTRANMQGVDLSEADLFGSALRETNGHLEESTICRRMMS